MTFDEVCTAAARARQDITEWLRQFDTEAPASIEDQEGRKVVIEGLTVTLEELTSVLTAYIDEV